jgi:tRNA A37 N6-isopentenylltransferase MiaA
MELQKAHEKDKKKLSKLTDNIKNTNKQIKEIKAQNQEIKQEMAKEKAAIADKESKVKEQIIEMNVEKKILELTIFIECIFCLFEFLLIFHQFFH